MTDDSIEEEWRPVVGYEGLYEVSSLGRMRSLDRYVTPNHGRWTYFVPGVVLKPLTQKSGHLAIWLSNGTARREMIHRLVLAAFVGPCPVNMEGCHNNGNPGDNRVSNLRWDTRSSNRRDSVIHRTHMNSRKTHCQHGHLLVEPNLKPAALKKGSRYCLACGRESSLAWMQKREFDIEAANRRYSEIMKDEF